MDSLANDQYWSIASAAEGLYKDRGSRFVAFAQPVESETEAKALLERLRSEYHDARHHCLAYRIGLGGKLFRASDDGEPAGSAGRPILSQIDSQGLSDVAVVVVRYFGGIKLGVPGLINAYRSATAAALAKAPRIVKSSGAWVKAEFPYEALPLVMTLIKEMNLPQGEKNFAGTCEIELRLRDSLREEFLQRIKIISNFHYSFI